MQIYCLYISFLFFIICFISSLTHSRSLPLQLMVLLRMKLWKTLSIVLLKRQMKFIPSNSLSQSKSSIARLIIFSLVVIFAATWTTFKPKLKNIKKNLPRKKILIFQKMEFYRPPPTPHPSLLPPPPLPPQKNLIKTFLYS